MTNPVTLMSVMSTTKGLHAKAALVQEDLITAASEDLLTPSLFPITGVPF